MTLNPFHDSGLFSMPHENVRKPLVFCCISGSREKVHCHEIG